MFLHSDIKATLKSQQPSLAKHTHDGEVKNKEKNSHSLEEENGKDDHEDGDSHGSCGGHGDGWGGDHNHDEVKVDLM